MSTATLCRTLFAALWIAASLPPTARAEQVPACGEREKLACSVFREQADTVGLFEATINVRSFDPRMLHLCCSLVGLHLNHFELSQLMAPYPEQQELTVQQFVLNKIAREMSNSPDAITEAEKARKQIAQNGLNAIFLRFAPKLPQLGQWSKVFAATGLVKETRSWGLSLPGAVVLIDTDYIMSRAEHMVAFTVAHELGHAIQRHYLQSAVLRGEDPYAFMRAPQGQESSSEKSSLLWLSPIERRQEMDADLFAIALTMSVGYRPDGLITELQAQANQGKTTAADLMDLEHPISQERIAYMQLAIRTLREGAQRWKTPMQAMLIVPPPQGN